MKYRGARLRRIAYANFISMDMRRTLCAAGSIVAPAIAHSPNLKEKATWGTQDDNA